MHRKFILLKMTMINDNQCRLQKNKESSNVLLFGSKTSVRWQCSVSIGWQAYLLQVTLFAITDLGKYKNSRYKDDALPEDDGGSHEMFAIRTFNSSWCIQRKPCRIDPGTTSDLSKISRFELYSMAPRRYLQDTTKPTMVCCKRRIVQTPPLKVIPIPLGYWQVNGEFHPMALSLIVAKQRRCLEACSNHRWAFCDMARNSCQSNK
jgi:hypothetical protein